MRTTVHRDVVPLSDSLDLRREQDSKYPFCAQELSDLLGAFVLFRISHDFLIILLLEQFGSADFIFAH